MNEKTIEDKSIKKLLDDHKGKKVAIFTHKIPDPDALGSLRGLEWLLKKSHEIECDLFYEGPISHPQNRAVVELLDIQLKKANEYNTEEYALNFLVDAIPGDKAGCNGKKVNFSCVLDHHKKAPNGGFNGIYLNPSSGSTCAIVYDLFNKLNIQMTEGNEEDSKVAVALMVGILTDTENLTSRDTTNLDFKANLELFPYRNISAFERILKWKVPQAWVKLKCDAEMLSLNDTDVGVAIAGVGIVDESQRDVLTYIADSILAWAGVETSIVFGFVESQDGADRIEGCIRSTDSSLQVTNFCETLAGEHGYGGGRTGKGAYCIPLREMSLPEDAPEEIRNKTWELVKIMQTNRIKKLINI